MKMKQKIDKSMGHWTNTSVEDFQSRITFDFIAQLEDRMAALPMKQRELADKLGVTESAVSQKLNNPDNLELKTIIAYSRALGMKVAVVPYDDDDADNTNGPVNSEIFTESWIRQGKPKSFLDLNPTLTDMADVMPKGRLLQGRWTTTSRWDGTSTTEKHVFKPVQQAA